MAVATATVSGGDDDSRVMRGRELEEGERHGEGERAVGGFVASPEEARAKRQAGGGRACAGVCRPRARPPGKEEDDRGGGQAGWAA